MEQWLWVFAIGVSIVAFFFPIGFTWMKHHIALLLGFIMFGMGTTLKTEDFTRVLQNPIYLIIGVLAQYGIMPFLGFWISTLLGLNTQLTAGVVLLGACPGGTASNVMAYLARANVGLSVSLTLLSTLLAPLLTPWLTWLYIHQVVQVDTWGLMIMIGNIVLFPILAGFAIRYFFQQKIEPILGYFPVLSALIIVAVIGCVVALNVDNLKQVTAIVLVTVILHNAGGLALGYAVGNLITNDKAIQRTLAIEVGMQNSGLASTLALGLPSFGHLASLPGAIFSVWHNITGAALASRWARKLESEGTTENKTIYVK